MFKAASWLSLTPEPERELPGAVATLTYGAHPPRDKVVAQEARLERLVLQASERRWLEYLVEVRRLIEHTARSEDVDVQRARSRAAAVLFNHHNLLLGLPGRAGHRTATERVILAELTRSIPLHQTPEEHA
jgi:hypothetical protein